MKRINSTIILILIILIHTLILCQDNKDFSKENELLANAVDINDIVGAASAYSVNGKAIWTGSSGYSNLEKKIPFTSSTITRIASIAKPMTATAIMQLVEKGKIDLNVSIQQYIPEFPTKNKTSITTLHLLAHRSGIDAYKNAKETETTKEYDNLTNAMEVFINRKLKFEPGTKYGYSSYGYIVLGVIIERVSGQSYEDYMTQNIWIPAGMNATGVEHFGHEYDNKSMLYHHEKGKTITAKNNNLSNRIPGGGLLTTLDDVIKFGDAILSYKLISKATMEEMVKIHSPRDDGNPYGLGWFLYGPHPQENVVIGHSGEQTGCSAQLFINRKRKSVVVTITNTSGKWKEVLNLNAQLLNLSNEHAPVD